jgi:hypothetical protein
MLRTVRTQFVLRLVALDSRRGKEGRVVRQGESRETGGKGDIYKIVYHEL